MEITPITLNYLFEVNCYLLKTETGFYLIDSGLHKKRGELEKSLEQAGCTPGDLRLIIITHGHTDHVGNAVFLKEKYGGVIAMHIGDDKMVETGDMFINMKGGLSLSLVRWLTNLLGFNSYENFKPDVYLVDCQELSEYGLDAKVLHTPGHSPGSTSILFDDGTLFCGDILGNTKKPEKTALVDDHQQLDASVMALKACETETVYPGHGKPFKMSDLQ
jgi:glyoxylase-like metal-dependent hydrolase (beta-lactamase superfamily II)